MPWEVKDMGRLSPRTEARLTGTGAHGTIPRVNGELPVAESTGKENTFLDAQEGRRDKARLRRGVVGEQFCEDWAVRAGRGSLGARN